MSKEEVIVTGYWNGDSNNWTLSKERSVDSDQLVVVSIETLPNLDKDKSLDDFQRSARKISRELRGFVRDLKKIR